MLACLRGRMELAWVMNICGEGSGQSFSSKKMPVCWTSSNGRDFAGR
jgi:hypothetical protein